MERLFCKIALRLKCDLNAGVSSNRRAPDSRGICIDDKKTLSFAANWFADLVAGLVSNRGSLAGAFTERLIPRKPFGGTYRALIQKNWTWLGISSLCRRALVGPGLVRHRDAAIGERTAAVEAPVRQCEERLRKTCCAHKPARSSFVKMAGENALAALQGLRGVSALHLLLYHSLSRTKWPKGWLVDIQVDNNKHLTEIILYSLPGRDSNAPLLPFIGILSGSLLWTAHVWIKIWKGKTFISFKR